MHQGYCAAAPMRARLTRLAAAAVPLLLLALAPLCHAEEPGTLNPYANQPYGGCEDGFCAAVDSDLEYAFYQAASEGNTTLMKQLMDNPALNISRNIVPDGQGFSRVMDVGLWAAVRNGHVEAAEMLLDLAKGDQLEDGHLVDLAAQHGAKDLIQMFLGRKYRVSSTALAYAAKYKHTEIMKLLLAGDRQIDMKGAMQAAASVEDPQVLGMLAEAGAMQAVKHPVTGRETAHDWQGEYAVLAAKSGNTLVLQMLFDQGYKLRWQTVQDLIKTAAHTGNVEVMRILLAHDTLAKDAEELEEAVDNALKVAAERGHEALVAWLVKEYPGEAKEACVGALLRATKFGRWSCVSTLRTLCNATSSSKKLQEAAWLGHLLTAARGGHTQVVKLLLAQDNARQLLGQLYSGRTDAGKAQGPPPPLPADQDPLMSAAGAGYEAIVDALLPYAAQMCGPCAAAQAALRGHLGILQKLVEGPAATVLASNEDTIQDSLQVMANALEGAHWNLVEWLIQNHEADAIGPYFLNAIASQGKHEDMKRMLQLIEKHCKDQGYVNDQVHSAMITAALTGQVELLRLLESSTVRKS